MYCFHLDSAIGRTDQGAKAKADSESGEDRGGLIQFYNSVYVLKMKSFALRYAHPAADNRVCILFLKFILFFLHDFIWHRNCIIYFQRLAEVVKVIKGNLFFFTPYFSHTPTGGGSPIVSIPLTASSASLPTANISETLHLPFSSQKWFLPQT